LDKSQDNGFLFFDFVFFSSVEVRQVNNNSSNQQQGKGRKKKSSDKERRLTGCT